METPEKIYILPSCHNRWYEEIRDDDNIEYIRTDAFIEKAVQWLKEQKEMVGISFQEDFIERFKNHMKGE